MNAPNAKGILSSRNVWEIHLKPSYTFPFGQIHTPKIHWGVFSSIGSHCIPLPTNLDLVSLYFRSVDHYLGVLYPKRAKLLFFSGGNLIFQNVQNGQNLKFRSWQNYLIELTNILFRFFFKAGKSKHFGCHLKYRFSKWLTLLKIN